MAKPTRQEYLVQQAKLLPPQQQAAALKTIAAAAKGGITDQELYNVNLGFERVLYGETGLGGTAGAKPGMAPAATTSVTTPATTPNPYVEEKAAQRRDAYALLQQTFSQ
jgi:hypothetical protein